MSRYMFAQCRAFGHAWKPTTVDQYRVRSKRLFVQHLECRTCGTLRRITINEKGIVYGNNYSYAEGYKLKGRNSKARNAKMRRDYLGI